MVCCEDILPFTDKTMRKIRPMLMIMAWALKHSIRNGSAVRRGVRIREIAAITVLTALAVALAWFLVAADMRSDLSALRPLRNATDVPTILIGWPELRDPQKASEFDRNLQPGDARIRMQGYMTEAARPTPDGEENTTFILMPRAGQILRAASRNLDDRVEVRLRRPARFSNRELVWVSGRIEHAARAFGGTSPASFVMRDSEVYPTEQREITHWFTP
jgi:hypothetical protein